jgi:phage shock protein C
MIAGVCGGLAEYFGIDPVIVRLIFVLMTLTSGIGLIVYPVLWLVMPKAGSPAGSAQQSFPLDAEEWRRRASALGQEAAQFGRQIGREMHEVFVREQPQQTQSRPAAQPFSSDEPPPQHAYNFDPLTGQPIRPSTPTTGPTVKLGIDPTQTQMHVPPAEGNSQLQPPVYYASAAPVAPRKRWRSIGLVLLGIGVLILADRIGIDLDIVFPLVMIGAGIMLLRRR